MYEKASEAIGIFFRVFSWAIIRIIKYLYQKASEASRKLLCFCRKMSFCLIFLHNMSLCLIFCIYRQNSKYSDKHQHKGFSAMKTGGAEGYSRPPTFLTGGASAPPAPPVPTPMTKTPC